MPGPEQRQSNSSLIEHGGSIPVTRLLPQLAAGAQPRGDGDEEGGPSHEDDGSHFLRQNVW